MGTSQRDPRSQPARTFRYVDISTIDRETKQILDPPTILGADAPSRARKQIQVSDVLVSTVRPALNAVAMVPDWLNAEIASTGFCVLRPNPDLVNPRFLYYRVRTPAFVQYLCDRATGASYPAVADAIVKMAPIAIPPLPEQKRILAILDAAEALRSLREQADRRTADLIPALFHEMFGDPATNPKGWPRIRLIGLCRSPDDIKCGPFGTQLHKDEFTTEGVPLWGIKNVNALFKLPTHEFLDKNTAERLQQYSVEPWDIVMTRKGTVGNCAVYPPAYPLGIMHSDLLRLRVDRERSDPTFLAHQLHHSCDVERQLAHISGGAVMPGINVAKLKKLEVLTPSFPLQRDFAARVAGIQAMEANQAASRRRLGNLFQSLLHRAFKGEL